MVANYGERKLSRRLLQASTSWPFLLSLCVLLLNDHWLKIAYPSLLTGKVSDFAGVFLLSLILFKGFPRRRVELGVFLSVLFVWWKSPASEPFIQVIRAFGFASFGRVVDYTDLLALTMLLVAYRVAGDIDSFQIPDRLPKQVIRVIAVTTTVFAILGTSLHPVVKPFQIYEFREVGSGSNLQLESAASVINTVAAMHGLKCKIGTCEGNGMVLMYFMKEPRTVTLNIYGRGGPGCKSVRTKMDSLKGDLKTEFGRRFMNLEFVEPLPQTGLH